VHGAVHADVLRPVVCPHTPPGHSVALAQPVGQNEPVGQIVCVAPTQYVPAAVDAAGHAPRARRASVSIAAANK